MLAVVILTLNEERHIERCLKEAFSVSDHVYVVDSRSEDRTIEIAQSCGAATLIRDFDNYGNQFNWALEQIDPACEWVFRLDADEIISETLKTELKKIHELPDDIDALACYRNFIFMGKQLKYGGLNKIKVVRCVRTQKANLSTRLVDEHFQGLHSVAFVPEYLTDHNLSGIDHWLIKHMVYAEKEAFQQLSDIHNPSALRSGIFMVDLKHWIKTKFVPKSPTLLGPTIYFIYRYFIRLGFLDGRRGFFFHFFQALWYRTLVEQKKLEKSSYIKVND